MQRRILTIILLFASPFMVCAQNDSLNALLDLSLEELMNVKVVTASGFAQSALEAPSTITVITKQQIVERGYEQLDEALRDVPGIDMIHINGYAPTLIYFRGMYGAENLRALLMIDGIVENNILGSNDMAGPAYSLHNVERIEIIWGPLSAIYGANAFGGVINIITQKGADMDGLHIEQGLGSFNTVFEKISVGMRKSKFEFSAAGTLYSSDGPRFTNRDPVYSASYVDRAFSLNGMLSYHAKKSTTTLGFRTYKTPMGWGTYANSPTTYLHLPSQGNLNVGTIGILQRDFRGERSGLVMSFLRTWFLQHEFRPGDKFNLLARGVYRETGTGQDSYVYITTDGNRLIRVMVASLSHRFSGELVANYALTENHHFSAGIQVSEDNVEAGARGTTIDLSTIYLVDGRDTVLNLHSTYLPRKYDIRNNWGGFLQYVLSTSWLGKTNISAALRYDNNSYFGDAVSPRLAVVTQPDSKFTFKLQFGKAFRAPSNLEIHQTPPTGIFKLKKERITTFEANAIYGRSKNFKLQLNLFRNELKDVIILGNLSGFTPDKNPGEITINGLETTADFVMSKNISSFFNFTFQDPKGKNLITGISGKVPGVAKFKANAGITFYAEDIFTFNFTGNWVGERGVPRTDPYGPVKGYFLANCMLSARDLLKKRISASIGIHNIFNAKWLDPGFRTADGLLYATVLEQPGINGLFKIGINF